MVGLSLNIPSSVVRPALASLLMGFAVREIYILVLPFFLSNSLATTISLLGGVIIFIPLAVITGSVRSEDLKSLPKIGAKAAVLLAAYENRRDSLLSKITDTRKVNKRLSAWEKENPMRKSLLEFMKSWTVVWPEGWCRQNAV